MPTVLSPQTSTVTLGQIKRDLNSVFRLEISRGQTFIAKLNNFTDGEGKSSHNLNEINEDADYFSAYGATEEWDNIEVANDARLEFLLRGKLRGGNDEHLLLCMEIKLKNGKPHEYRDSTYGLYL